jgi:hypothetical protein
MSKSNFTEGVEGRCEEHDLEFEKNHVIDGYLFFYCPNKTCSEGNFKILEDLTDKEWEWVKNYFRR